LFDAFRQFDHESLGYLTIKDLINGLEALNVNESQSDVILFFRKYDKNNECRIRFSEFADVLCPKDKIYAQLLS
jgi:Ca2+-binding EF-hand superfamily protein